MTETLRSSGGPLYLDSSFRDYKARIKGSWGYGRFTNYSDVTDKDGDNILDSVEQTIIDFDTEDAVQNYL